MGRAEGRGGGSGCEERWKSRRRGGEPTTREKREGTGLDHCYDTM